MIGSPSLGQGELLAPHIEIHQLLARPCQCNAKQKTAVHRRRLGIRQLSDISEGAPQNLSHPCHFGRACDPRLVPGTFLNPIRQGAQRDNPAQMPLESTKRVVAGHDPLEELCGLDDQPFGPHVFVLRSSLVIQPLMSICRPETSRGDRFLTVEVLRSMIAFQRSTPMNRPPPS